MQCPHCTAVLPDDDLFCEECGRPLKNPNAPICLCGAPEGDLDEDGYCLQCGRRCRPAPGDHCEIEVSPDFATVSDRGRHHHRNEDRCAILELEEGKLLVVCDGVSSSTDAQTAAQAAVEAIAHTVSGDGDLATALQHAGEAVRALDSEAHESAPSTTAVVALFKGGAVQIGWVGDSRAYWISKDNAQQLTTDHSWLNDVVASGETTYEEAVESPRAHAITRWLGADAALDMQPGLLEFTPMGAGYLLLCTDGLWNYAAELPQLSELVLAHPEESALETARRLVNFANEAGGQDNISVALLRLFD